MSAYHAVAELEAIKLHSLMGLKLNAETREEIAVSILAEVGLMLKLDGHGRAMSWHGKEGGDSASTGTVIDELTKE